MQGSMRADRLACHVAAILSGAREQQGVCVASQAGPATNALQREAWQHRMHVCCRLALSRPTAPHV